MTLPLTVANPQTLSVTTTAVAVVAPCACNSVTIQQQQGSDPPSHKFQPFLIDAATKLGAVQAGGSNFRFSANINSGGFTPGQVVGYVGLISGDTGTALFSVFGDPQAGGKIQPPDRPFDARLVVTLTSAQLLALQTTAVQLLSGLPGYVYRIKDVMFNYVAGTTAYTLGNADNVIQLEYTGKSTSLAKAALAGFVDQTVNGFIPASSPLTTDLASTNCAGLGVELKITGTTAALTLGNGIVNVILDYSLVPVS